VSEIEEEGGVAIYSCGSVADYDYAGELIQLCVDHYGRIDGLLNIAGIAEPPNCSILNTSAEDWNRVIGVHLNGTFNTCRHAAPFMVAQASGAIVNTGSHAFLGIYGGTAYAAGKGGINSLSAAIAKDLAEHNVRCNVVNPGAKTRLSSNDDTRARIQELFERGLLDQSGFDSAQTPADPSVIAPVFAYLVSDRAAHINGKILSVSGRHVGLFPWMEEEILAYSEQSRTEPWEPEIILDKL
jgi:NAD(P)-dependent dehydrogenase (short-subunit alcohol dehydrogenase family)